MSFISVHLMCTASDLRRAWDGVQVEYLKAQLSSEQTLKAELEATVTGMKEKLLKVRRPQRSTRIIEGRLLQLIPQAGGLRRPNIAIPCR
jgi:hypothetical protein